jgi:hypothetical protein
MHDAILVHLASSFEEKVQVVIVAQKWKYAVTKVVVSIHFLLGL